MHTRYVLVILSILSYSSLSFAQVEPRQIVAEPESDKVQRIIGNMRIHGAEISFSNIRGHLTVERLKNIFPPVGFPGSGLLKVYKLKNAAEFFKNRHADFFAQDRRLSHL